MIIKGVVVSGAILGQELIKMYEDRIAHIIGFKPYRGTLDIKIEKNIKLEDYATRRIEHILLNGRPQIYAYLVPVRLKVLKSNEEEDCWLIKTPDSGISDIIEIITNHNLRERHNLKDNEEVEITFFKKVVKKKKPVTQFFKRLSGKETRISR